jgi:hypothetical protein
MVTITQEDSSLYHSDSWYSDCSPMGPKMMLSWHIRAVLDGVISSPDNLRGCAAWWPWEHSHFPGNPHISNQLGQILTPEKRWFLSQCLLEKRAFTFFCLSPSEGFCGLDAEWEVSNTSKRKNLWMSLDSQAGYKSKQYIPRLDTSKWSPGILWKMQVLWVTWILICSWRWGSGAQDSRFSRSFPPA